MDPITVPSVPNLDAYLYAYAAWAKALIGHNLVFFSGLGGCLWWVAKRTSWSWDDKLLEMGQKMIVGLTSKYRPK